MLVNNVNIQSTYQPHPCTHSIRRSKTLFQTGYIYLNNRRVFIHKTLQKTADSINKISCYTNVKAKILSNTKGVERLVLISSKRIINIHDPNRIFYDLFRQKKIGSGEDKVVQGVGTRTKNDVKINYSSTKAVLKEVLKFSPKLSSSVIVTMASMPQIKVAPLLKEPIPVAPVNRDVSQYDSALSNTEIEDLKTFMDPILQAVNTWKSRISSYSLKQLSSKLNKVKEIRLELDKCRDIDGFVNVLNIVMTSRTSSKLSNTSTIDFIIKQLNAPNTTNITKQLFMRTLRLHGDPLSHKFTYSDFDLTSYYTYQDGSVLLYE